MTIDMGVTHSDFNPSPDTEMGYSQLFSILLRRGLWLVGGVGLGVAAATLLTLRTKPTYESSMQLIVEPNYQEDVRQTENGGSDRQRQTDYATQLTLMRSDQFLTQALEDVQEIYPDLDLSTIKSSFFLTQVEEDDVDTRIF